MRPSIRNAKRVLDDRPADAVKAALWARAFVLLLVFFVSAAIMAWLVWFLAQVFAVPK